MTLTLGQCMKILGVRGPLSSITKADLRRAYRAQARRLHPDKGGTVEAMQALNDARRHLDSVVGCGGSVAKEHHDAKVADRIAEIFRRYQADMELIGIAESERVYSYL